MKNKINIKVTLFVLVCMLLNLGGRLLSDRLQLPMWLDCFGTVLTSINFGPVCGAIVGVSNNIVYGFTNHVTFAYSVTSISIAFVVGRCAQKKQFETVFGTLTASVLCTLATIGATVPLNVILYSGRTNNIWGDGVIGKLSEEGVPIWLCYIIGEFYVDFLDKILTLFGLYGVLKLRQYVLRKRGGHSEPDEEDTSSGNKGAAAKAFSVLLCLVLTAGMVPALPASAEYESELTDYSDYIHTVYSSDNGLPCGEANDIAQTKDGILWIGTYAGLYRYNGREFRHMNEYSSVRNVNCLYSDDEGRLWIGTNDNGLSISINETVSSVVDKATGLPSDSVRCITQTSDGDYYIGTTESMAVISLSGGLKIKNVIDRVHYATTLTADDEGHAAVVDSDGRLFLMGGGEILDTKELSSGSETYNCCTFNSSGLLYAGTSEDHMYIYKVEGGRLRQTSVFKPGELYSIQSVTFSEDGRGFLCADNGVGMLDTSNRYYAINTGSFNNSIDNMTIDYQGNLWFTSSRLGLLRLSESPFTDLYRVYGFENKVVNSVEEWNGQIYFGTDLGLDAADISTHKQVTNELTHMFDGIRIRCIRRDSENNLWLCTYGMGLVMVKPDMTVKVFDQEDGTFGNRARVAMEMKNGCIAAAGDSGMSFIEKGSISKTLKYGDGLSNAMILSLLELNDGSVLAGTDGDGIAVVKNGAVTRTLTRYDGLSSGVILRMFGCSDGEHTLIVTSNALCIMDSSYNIASVTNFPYTNNYDIWSDGQGKLFVLSSAGIYVVNESDVINNTKDMNYELLDSNRGMSASLTANAWNHCDENGRLYLSCDSGVYKMEMGSYSSKKRSYRLLLSNIKLDGKQQAVERGGEVTVPRGTGRLEIFPEVVNFSNENPYVSYYLEGFDPEPTVVLQNELDSITYTNLPGGDYTFRLSVLDGNRSQVLEQTVYRFSKEKEIYDNSWFIVYMLLVAALAIVWLTWFVARGRMQHTLMIQQQHLELAEKQIQMGNETILAIAKTVDAKDENTSQHSQRVSEYAVMIGERLGMSREERENLRKAALLHDIGKIGIPDRILNKPDRLTDEEYAVMKTHVVRGGEILKDFTLIENVVDGALYHHERYDGKGYMHGLSGDDIPLYGRIIGVADAFDAMTANRVYRKKLDFDYVVKELERCRGTQFDPKMADIMLELIRDGSIDIERIYGKRGGDK